MSQHLSTSASLFGGFPSDVFFPGFDEDEGFAPPSRVPQIVAPQPKDFQRSPLEKFLTLAAPVAQALVAAQLARRRRDRTRAFLGSLASGGIQTGISELGRGRRIDETLRQGQNQAQVQQFGLGEQAARTDIARQRGGDISEIRRLTQERLLANEQRERPSRILSVPGLPVSRIPEEGSAEPILFPQTMQGPLRQGATERPTVDAPFVVPFPQARPTIRTTRDARGLETDVFVGPSGVLGDTGVARQPRPRTQREPSPEKAEARQIDDALDSLLSRVSGASPSGQVVATMQRILTNNRLTRAQKDKLLVRLGERFPGNPTVQKQLELRQLRDPNQRPVFLSLPPTQ